MFDDSYLLLFSLIYMPCSCSWRPPPPTHTPHIHAPPAAVYIHTVSIYTVTFDTADSHLCKVFYFGYINNIALSLIYNVYTSMCLLQYNSIHYKCNYISHIYRRVYIVKYYTMLFMEYVINLLWSLSVCRHCVQGLKFKIKIPYMVT